MSKTDTPAPAPDRPLGPWDIKPETAGGALMPVTEGDPAGVVRLGLNYLGIGR